MISCNCFSSFRMLLHKNEFKLKKGSGFHLDQFILGFIIFLCALFGLPWMCPATVRSVAHVSALAVMSRTHAPGEKPKLLGVKDQRVTNIVMNILIGMLSSKYFCLLVIISIHCFYFRGSGPTSLNNENKTNKKVSTACYFD